MDKDLKKISDHWREVYSRRVEEYRRFNVSKEFKRYASLFSVGNSYMYIVNLHNFELEYVSESVRIFVDKEAADIGLEDLMKTVQPEDIERIKLKSKVIADFYTSFLDKESALNYKNMFSYRMKDTSGKLRTMLYQAIPLSVLENGMPEHVLCIQTDVSHLKLRSTNTVSFVNIEGGKCYFNVDVAAGKFDLRSCESEKDEFAELFSKREKQIVNDLARGLSAQEIASKLNLSPHTVKTHRKNILQKSGCGNTTELVAKCIAGGVISLNLD